MQNVYYKGITAARMERNGKQVYNSNIETEYKGKDGHIVADINGEHFEKKWNADGFQMPINISPYSSIEMLKEKYGLLGKKNLKKSAKKSLKKTTKKRGKRQTRKH
jgi:hypothetical protein